MSKVSDERLAELIKIADHHLFVGSGDLSNLADYHTSCALRELQSLRSASTPAKAERVKGLEWHGGKYGQIADSVFGTWWARNPFSDGRVQLEGPFGHSMHPSTDAAVNAAEADYRQRILSALEDAPQQEVVGYVRQETLDKLREGDAGPIVGIAAFDTVIPLYALSHPSTPATGSDSHD